MQLFIDTNIFINYLKAEEDYPEKLFEDLQKLIIDKKINLLITNQVIDEYNRNIEIVKNQKIKDILSPLHNQLKEEKIHVNNFSEFKKKTKEFIKKCETTFKKQKDQIKKKKIDFKKREKILDNFFKQHENIIINPDYETLKLAESRYIKGNPPKKDRERAESFGDAINWELILKHGENKNPLIILTDDSDYSSDGKKIHGFLKKEWREKHDGTTQLYKGLASFLGQYGKSSVDKSVVERAESIRKYQSIKEFEDYIQYITLKLEPFEKKILEMRYGFYDGVEHNEEEVAREFGTSREIINKTLSIIFKKIKKPIIGNENY